MINVRYMFQAVLEENSLKDDDAPYANGILTTSVVVFLSYVQNCLLPAFLIVRLPWIIGFLGLWEFLAAIGCDLILVWFNAKNIKLFISLIYGSTIAIAW